MFRIQQWTKQKWNGVLEPSHNCEIAKYDLPINFSSPLAGMDGSIGVVVGWTTGAKVLAAYHTTDQAICLTNTNTQLSTIQSVLTLSIGK